MFDNSSVKTLRYSVFTNHFMYTQRYAHTFQTSVVTQQSIIQNFSSYDFEKAEVSVSSWRKIRNLIFLYLY